MNNMTFCEVKKMYNEFRENERRKIIDHLAERKDDQNHPLFLKKSGEEYLENKYKYAGGSGRTGYGDRENRRLNPPYDLSNWKYIETSYKGRVILISLQCFDLDPSSKNIHVLFDRIGVLIGEPEFVTVGKETVMNAFLKMIPTKWTLPLSNDEVDELLKWIIDESEKGLIDG